VALTTSVTVIVVAAAVAMNAGLLALDRRR